MKNLNIPVWTALVTPFLKGGDIDFKSLEALILEQEKAENGLLLLGSTGEALSLDLPEKKSILDYLSKMPLKVPLMIGVGGFQLEAQREWISLCQSMLKVDAFLLVTPMYTKPGVMGQTHWFEALLETAQLPCMLYNIPGRAGVKLHAQVLKNLKDHPRLWALKESSGSVDDFKALQHANSQVIMYSGDDGLAPDHVRLGAAGLVSVASNAWPSQTHQLMRRCLAHKAPALNVWYAACESLFLASNPIPIKALLHHKGFITSPQLRLPLCIEDLTEAQLQIIFQQDQAMSAGDLY